MIFILVSSEHNYQAYNYNYITKKTTILLPGKYKHAYNVIGSIQAFFIFN